MTNTNEPLYDVADALRTAAADMLQAIQDGYRSRAIDADDLAEILLTIADRLDPIVSPPPGPAARACPECGERRSQRLAPDPVAADLIRCTSCGITFEPAVR